MSLTVRQLIQKASDLAQRGLTQPMDLESLAEPLLPNVFTDLALEYAGNEQTDLLPSKVKTLVFTNGSATFTNDVLQSCVDQASLVDADNPTNKYAYIPGWEDFINTVERRMGYFTIRDDSEVRMLDPQTAYDPSSGPSGNREYTSPCVWEIPADIDVDIGVSTEVETGLISKLANALIGVAQPTEQAAA